MCFLTPLTTALQHKSDSDNPVDNNHLVKRKTKTSFDENTKNGHNKSERLNLLRQFVLDDFSSDEQNSDESDSKKSMLLNVRQDRYLNTIRDGKQFINYPDNQYELSELSKNGSSSDLSSKAQNSLSGDLNSSKIFSNGGNDMGSRSSFLKRPFGMKISSNIIKDRLREQEIPIKRTKKQYNDLNPLNQSEKTSSKPYVSVYREDDKLLRKKNDTHENDNKHILENQDVFSETKYLRRNDKSTIESDQGNVQPFVIFHAPSYPSDTYGDSPELETDSTKFEIQHDNPKVNAGFLVNVKNKRLSEMMAKTEQFEKTIKIIKRKDYRHSSIKMQKNDAFDKKMHRKSNMLRRSHHVSSVTKHRNKKNYSTEGLNKDIVGNAKRNLQVTKFETTTKSKKKIEIIHRNSGDSPSEKRFLGSSHDDQIINKFGADADDNGDDDKYDDDDDDNNDENADADDDADIGDDYGDDNDDVDDNDDSDDNDDDVDVDVDVDDEMENENDNHEMNDVSQGNKTYDFDTVFKNNWRGKQETNKIDKHIRDINKEEKVVNDDDKSDNNVDGRHNNNVEFVDYTNNRKHEREKDKNNGVDTYGNSNAQNFESLKSKHATYDRFKQTKYGHRLSVAKKQNDSINPVNSRSHAVGETTDVDLKALNYQPVFKTNDNSENMMLPLNQSSDFTKVKTVKNGTNGIFKNKLLTLLRPKHDKSSKTNTDRVTTLMQTGMEIKSRNSDVSTKRTSIKRPKKNQNGSYVKPIRNERGNQSSQYVLENTKNEKLKRGVPPTVMDYLEIAHQNQEKTKEHKKDKLPKSLEGNAIKSNLEYWNKYRHAIRNNHGSITKTRISIDKKYIPAFKRQPRKGNRKISMETFVNEKSQQDVINSILKGELFDLKTSDQVSTEQRENKISTNYESALNHKNNNAKGNLKLKKKRLRKRKHFETKRSHGLKNRIIIEQPMPETGFDLYILRVSPKLKRSNFTASQDTSAGESFKDRRNYTVKQKPNTDHQIQLNEVNNKRGGRMDLVQKILDQPLKSVVNFLRPYIFGKANAGNMTLRDSLSHELADKRNSGVPEKGSMIRSESKSFKEHNSNRKSRINWKISSKNLWSNSTSMHGRSKLSLRADIIVRNDILRRKVFNDSSHIFSSHFKKTEMDLSNGGMQKNLVNETTLKTVLKPSMPIDSGNAAKTRIFLTNRRENNSIISSDLKKMTMKKVLEHDYRNSQRNNNKPNRIESLETLVRKNISLTQSKEVHNLTVNDASSSGGKSMDNSEVNGVPRSILSKNSDNLFNSDPVEEDIRVFISDEMLEEEQNVYGKNVKKSLTPRNEINLNNVYYIPLKGKIYKHKATGSMEDAMISVTKRSKIINSTKSNRRSTNKNNKTQISLRSSIGRFELWNQFLETNQPTKSIINQNVIDRERTAYPKGDNVQEISRTEADNAYPSWESTSIDLQKNSYQMYSDNDGNIENKERNFLHTGPSPHLEGANIASAQYTFHIRPRTMGPSDIPLRFSKKESSPSYKG